MAEEQGSFTFTTNDHCCEAFKLVNILPPPPMSAFNLEASVSVSIYISIYLYMHAYMHVCVCMYLSNLF